MTPWIAVLIAMFVWWFSTGAILMAVKMADQAGARARKTATLVGLPLLICGTFGIWWTLEDASVLGAYIAFLSALAIWGWIELAFLTGIITGPNREVLPVFLEGWPRFLRAVGTVIYHELLLASSFVALFFLTFEAPNIFGMLTFGVLFFARISAKLNLFFGVPRIHAEFLPDALSHLPSHFRYRRGNWFFPISVTLLTLAIFCWLERLYMAETAGALTGFALLSALTALALLEHWVMVLPIPDERLWRWMMPASPPAQTRHNQNTETGGHHGL
ncbi:MAG: putative photosynthetic complex assembly protein PuhE [Pseudomonadota bacterium]